MAEASSSRAVIRWGGSRAGSSAMGGKHLPLGPLPFDFGLLPESAVHLPRWRPLRQELPGGNECGKVSQPIIDRKAARSLRLAGDYVGRVWEVIRPFHRCRPRPELPPL